jgi:hypothetical protein
MTNLGNLGMNQIITFLPYGRRISIYVYTIKECAFIMDEILSIPASSFPDVVLEYPVFTYREDNLN